MVGGFGEGLLGIFGYDQAPNGACESNVFGGPILLLQLGHIMVVYVAGRAGHSETIAVAGGAAQGSRGEAAEPDGWMRFLNRFRSNFDVLEIEEIALVGHRLSTEKTPNDVERLVGSRPTFPEGHTKAVELFQLKADPDAELKAAA